jgi:cytochrome c-type biogenesis protein CcmH/NrfG
VTLDQILVLIGIVMAAVLGSIPLVQSWRKDARDRDQQARDAISTAMSTAIEPLRRELDQIHDDIKEIREQRGPRGGRRD